MSNSPILGIVEIDPTQANKSVTHNNAVVALEASVNASYYNTTVSGADITLNSATCVGFYAYVMAGATGARSILFQSLINGAPAKRVFALVNAGAFSLTVRATTLAATVIVGAGKTAICRQDGNDLTAISIFDGAAPSPNDVAFFIPGLPANNVTVAIFRTARAYTLSDNFAGSVGFCAVNPTATATFTVYRNGTSIGTVAISTAGVFTFNTTGSGTEAFAVGDRLRLDSPTPQDTTLADVAITFFGAKA